MSTSTNAFLRAQRKYDLVELAESVGLANVDGLKKSELEVALDNYLSDNQQHAANPQAAPFYQSRARAMGSPIKKDFGAIEPRRRRGASKLAEQAISQISQSADDDSELPAEDAPDNRLAALADRVNASPAAAEVKRVFAEGTVALRERVGGILEETGVKTVNENTRDALSTVFAIITCISGFEVFHLRKEILADRYAFTIPGIGLLGTPDYPVMVPDVFLFLQGSFWIPFLLWLTTSVLVPSVVGWYFNLAAAHRRRSSQPDYPVDPLIFSITKAVLTYVVYQQGNSFGGWVNQEAVARINSAVYGGWKGVLTGAFISGVASVYDAVLSR